MSSIFSGYKFPTREEVVESRDGGAGAAGADWSGDVEVDSRCELERWIRLLIGVNVVLVALLAAAIAARPAGTRPAGHPAQAAVRRRRRHRPELMEMGLAHIPTNNDCVLCHEATAARAQGRAGHPAPRRGLAALPRLPHRTSDSAARRPATRASPRRSASTATRSAQAGPAITQPHAELPGQACLTATAASPTCRRAWPAPTSRTACCATSRPSCRRRRSRTRPTRAGLPQLPPVRAGRRAADRSRPALRPHLPALPRHRPGGHVAVGDAHAGPQSLIPLTRWPLELRGS